MLEEEAGDERPQRRDRATERRPQRDRPGPAGSGPQRGDEGERRRIGHAGRHAADDPGDDQDLDRRGERGEETGRDRQQHAQDEHQLAAVAVTQRAEPQHRRRQTERVADGHEIERGLRGAERRADVGQGDVRHGQVQVGDRRDQDQREEDEAGRSPAPGRPMRAERPSCGRRRVASLTLCHVVPSRCGDDSPSGDARARRPRATRPFAAGGTPVPCADGQQMDADPDPGIGPVRDGPRQQRHERLDLSDRGRPRHDDRRASSWRSRPTRS